MIKNFQKNDNSFVCQNCGKEVPKLVYSSRDHCNKCLCSIHIDHLPGDRANECLGLLVPVGCTYNAKKGYVIEYKCQKCKQLHNNKAAEDDSMATILSLMNQTYNHEKFRR